MTSVEGDSTAPDSSSITPSADIDTLHFRQGRARRHSLSDMVSVGRIAAVPPQETFEEATQEINEELDRKKNELSNSL